MLPEVAPEELSDEITSSYLAIETEDAAQRVAALAETPACPPTVDVLYELLQGVACPRRRRASCLGDHRDGADDHVQRRGQRHADSSFAEEALKQHPDFQAASKGKERLKDGSVKFPITIALGLEATPTAT